MLTWKKVVIWFCKVVCLHTQGEVRHFGTLRCVIHSWLIWYKSYRNRSIFAKVVVAKSLLPRFFVPHSVVFLEIMGLSCLVFEIWPQDDDGRQTTDDKPATATVAYLTFVSHCFGDIGEDRSKICVFRLFIYLSLVWSHREGYSLILQYVSWFPDWCLWIT